MKGTLLERFQAKYKVNRKGCWVWEGSRHAEGYGVIRFGNTHRLAHRIGYELLVGPIPKGRELDHLCRNPACVNPAHLEAVTHRENILRGKSPAAQHARKTHCIRGHDLTEAHINPRGARVCNACCRARRREQT